MPPTFWHNLKRERFIHQRGRFLMAVGKNERSSFIEIETHDKELEFDLMSNPSALQQGVEVILPDGSKLAWQPGELRKGFGLPKILHYLLVYGRDVSAGVLGSYLYEKLKGRATVLRVDRQEIQIEEGEITRIITEHIEKSD
jgi:hypothetical protein